MELSPEQEVKFRKILVDQCLKDLTVEELRGDEVVHGRCREALASSQAETQTLWAEEAQQGSRGTTKAFGSLGSGITEEHVTMKFRKKPVVIEAMQFTNEDKDRCFNFVRRSCYACFDSEGKPSLKIHTLEVDMTASLGDWIIKGVNGEFYPCKPDIFEKTYAAVSDAPLATVEDRYSDLLQRLGCLGHDGAVAEIASLRKAAGLNKEEGK